MNGLKTIILTNTSMEIGNQTSIEWDVWNQVNIIKIIFFIIVGIIILMLNSAVIVAFVKYPSVRTPTNYFLLSLVTADVLLVVLTLPGHLLGEFDVFGDNELACVVINSPTLAIPCAALLSLICASVERYIAVVHPLRYQAIHSRGNMIALTIALIWLYSVLLGILPVAGINNITARATLNSSLPFCNFVRVTPGKYVGFVTLSTYLPGMIVFGALNLRIFMVAHYQRQKVQHEIRQIRGKTTTEGKSKRKRIVLLTLGHIYVIAHIPFLLTMAIDYKYFTVDIVQEFSVPFEIYVLTSCLVAMCPLAYPLVMAFGNREIRTCIFKMCPRRFKRQVTSVNTVSIANINNIQIKEN